MRLLGIDLGTTNTVASIENYIHSVSDEGERLLPSVVAFLPNRSTQVGSAATQPRRTPGPKILENVRATTTLRLLSIHLRPDQYSAALCANSK